MVSESRLFSTAQRKTMGLSCRCSKILFLNIDDALHNQWIFLFFYLPNLQEVVYLALSILPNIECAPQLRAGVPQAAKAHACRTTPST